VNGRRWTDETGLATPVEMMYLLVFCLAAVLFLGFLGRLQAAGVQVSNTAQAAARAASQAPDAVGALAAAEAVVAGSALASRCQDDPHLELAWVPSATGAWQGGSVTVRVSCSVSNRALAGVWAPGSRTVVVSDTQPVDRYRR
jgi:Flp pilus assembly protein TadG